ncbi:MAG: RPA12/RPB9/RPC11 RNA polymerase family protein [Candidatus Hodarchaeota archaeon]
MIRFCDKINGTEKLVDAEKSCGTLLLPEKRGNQTFLICKKCGNALLLEKPGDYTEKLKIQHTGKERTLIIESIEEINLPTIAISCPRCSNNTAWFMQIQVRSADESTSLFYRCQRCYHTWKEQE